MAAKKGGKAKGTKATKKPTRVEAVRSGRAKLVTRPKGNSTEVDTRLPPAGTVIEKRDRHGEVRCSCEVTAEGIKYAGNIYSSLSGAAMAAAKDLGLTNKSQNGFVFWGLSKPPRPLPIRSRRSIAPGRGSTNGRRRRSERRRTRPSPAC